MQGCELAKRRRLEVVNERIRLEKSREDQQKQQRAESRDEEAKLTTLLSSASQRRSEEAFRHERELSELRNLHEVDSSCACTIT